jgi:hypothetical protein
MVEEIKLWQVEHGKGLVEITRSKLELEIRLENWLKSDISILSPNLLTIGQQVGTAFGKYIDLLCMDSKGDLVIVELKRDKTPREVTAQVLDYGSWIKDLSHDDVVNLANLYLEKKELNLVDAFEQKFRSELPEILNNAHSMLIVASEIDDSTERIIRYLSDSYGVNINVAKFQYFRNSGNQEFLARIFLIEQAEVEKKSLERPKNKREPYLTPQQLEEIANDNGIGDLYRRLAKGLEGKFNPTTSRTMLNFRGNIGGSNKAILNFVPEKSSSDKGLYFQIYLKRFAEYSGMSEESIRSILPIRREEWKYYENADEDFSGFDGYFKDFADIEIFLNGIQNVVRR